MTVSVEIEDISRMEESCANVMTIPRIGPLISTAMVAAVGQDEVFDQGRDIAAWTGVVPRQCGTGGRTILGRITQRGIWCGYLVSKHETRERKRRQNARSETVLLARKLSKAL